LNRLKQMAKEAATKAYVPYSKFPVGAALSLSGTGLAGEFIQGCNVENASYPMSICAERNALVQAIAKGVEPGTLKEIAIYMPGEKLYSPCGACRQVIAELMAKDAVVYAYCDTEEEKRWTVSELLPDGFEF